MEECLIVYTCSQLISSKPRSTGRLPCARASSNLASLQPHVSLPKYAGGCFVLSTNGVPMKDAIKVENLRKVFESSKRHGWLRSEKVEVVSVRDVSFEIPIGQSVAFIGPNGAGKSTTIKMLTGILRPGGGRAEVLSRRRCVRTALAVVVSLAA
jgi:ABC-type glutathione transport system ATPase component